VITPRCGFRHKIAAQHRRPPADTPFPLKWSSIHPTRQGDALMEQERYKGYVLWGHAIAQQEELLAPERYAGSGTITLDLKLVEASGILGTFDTEQEAQDAGLSWARAWVDSHG
jgi:hypothetical protein